MQREFLKFLVAGGLAALVNIASRWVLDLVLSYQLAIVLAYLIGMATAYGLSRVFVFEASDRKVGSEVLRFALVNLLAVGLVLGISLLLARWLFPAIGFTFYADDIAHMIGVAVPAVTSYFGHKYFTFQKVRS